MTGAATVTGPGGHTVRLSGEIPDPFAALRGDAELGLSARRSSEAQVNGNTTWVTIEVDLKIRCPQDHNGIQQAMQLLTYTLPDFARYARDHFVKDMEMKG